MNILYTNDLKFQGGGHDTYILSLLKNPQHKKYVACPPTSSLYSKLMYMGFANLIPMSFPSKFAKMPQTIRESIQIKKFIEEHDIDVVHANGSKDSWSLLYAKLFSKKKFKVIFTKHNSMRVHNALSEWRYNTINDGMIFVSKSIHNTIGMKNIKPPVRVIENCIDTDLWCRSTPPTLAKDDTIHLISNAGTAYYKRWDNMIHAILELPAELQKRVRISVLGNYIHHKNEYELLKQFPEELQQRMIAPMADKSDSKYSNITFTGMVTDSRAYLETADVGFLLSDSIETISFACREMMSMSLPLIVSDFGSLSDNIDTASGWVTKTNDVESIKKVLIDILNMPKQQLHEMKLAARKKAERDFVLSKMFDATNEFYQIITN